MVVALEAAILMLQALLPMFAVKQAGEAIGLADDMQLTVGAL